MPSSLIVAVTPTLLLLTVLTRSPTVARPVVSMATPWLPLSIWMMPAAMPAPALSWASGVWTVTSALSGSPTTVPLGLLLRMPRSAAVAEPTSPTVTFVPLSWSRSPATMPAVTPTPLLLMRLTTSPRLSASLRSRTASAPPLLMRMLPRSDAEVAGAVEVAEPGGVVDAGVEVDRADAPGVAAEDVAGADAGVEGPAAGPDADE